jgi:hypothetical protein
MKVRRIRGVKVSFFECVQIDLSAPLDERFRDGRALQTPTALACRFAIKVCNFSQNGFRQIFPRLDG